MLLSRWAPSPRRRRKPERTAFRPGTEPVERRLLPSASPADVLTYHNDNNRTGQDLHETILTPANVNASSFGKLFNDPVDGSVYAQPLYMAKVAIPGQGTHNVVFVATEHDSVYAFDADSGGAPLWHVSFINPAAGVTTVPAVAPYQLDLYPEVGITSTPVIDPNTGTLYVVAETRETAGGAPVNVFKLHALDIATGAEKMGGPSVIAASVPGRGTGHGRGNIVRFNPEFLIQRPGLLLSNGVVYSAYASLGDHGPYHGWIIGNNAQTLQTVAAFNDTPNGSEGGVWMSGGGLAADAAGGIYAITGNGTFTAASGGKDYGNSFLKLTGNLRVTDYSTPSNQRKLSAKDLDLGSGGALLVPDQPGPRPHLLIGGGKEGTVYVLNRDNLGHYRPKKARAPQLIPNPGHSVYSTPAYFDGTVYVHAVGDVLEAYRIVNGTLVGPVAQGAATFNYPGATPSISADGTRDGIVWELQATGVRGSIGTVILHASDAGDVSNELYNSAQSGDRDKAGQAVKFTVPTVANGKVHVGTQTGLAVYGLLG